MRQFSQESELDHLLAHDKLQYEMIDATADLIANFHQKIGIAKSTSDYGNPDRVYQPIQENFKQIREKETDVSILELLSDIEQWSEGEFNKIKPVLAERKKNGFIRECHGDLHLRNIAWYKNKPLAFDCLEFNPNFRWIDVISEVAFLTMDLEDHQQSETAQRFLNRYLELTGDYKGCQVLRLYLVYRATVRAKVDAIRSHQPGIRKHDAIDASKKFYSYLQLAQTYTKQTSPFIIITRGMSGSGKSKWSQSLLEKLNAIRIRSDVERKRLFNIDTMQDSHENVEQGIYNSEATSKTYLKLLELAEDVVDAGLPVIIDTTFTMPQQRSLIKKLEIQKNIPFIIIEFTAVKEIFRQRVVQRKNNISDADINVLENQIIKWQPLEANEKTESISVNTGEFFNVEELLNQVKSKLHSL